MDQRLPSGQPPDAAPPSAPSGVAKVKQTPEQLSRLETKQDSKLESSLLVSRLQQDVVSADGTAGRNGDIDATSDELIKGKQKPYSHVDSHKETVTTISKTELDSKKTSSPKKSDSHKITSIQFAELPMDPSMSSTRSMRDPEMKTDLQRSSTVPEISLRKESSEETVTVANIANADIASIASRGSSSLIDWNSENRTLYRNNVEMRSVGNLTLHSTIEEEPGYRHDKTKMGNDTTEMRNRETPLSKSETRTIKTVITTTGSTNGKGTMEQKVLETTSETLPSKCEVSHHTASPSHVTVTFPKDISKTEISVNKIEKVSDSIAESRLPHVPAANLEQVPTILDKTPKSKDKESSEMPSVVKEEKTTSGTAQSSQKIQQIDESCKQNVSIKMGQETLKDYASGEKHISTALLHEKEASVDITKIYFGPEQDDAQRANKRTSLDKTITTNEGNVKKQQVSLADTLKGIDIEKTFDKSKDDKISNLEKQTEEPSKPITAVDQTKTLISSSIQDTKSQERKDFVSSKKESSVSLAEELKLELPLTTTLDITDKSKVQKKEIEKLPLSEARDSKLQPQLTEEKKKIVEPPVSLISDKSTSSQTIIPEQIKITHTESKDKVHPSEKHRKQNGPLTESLLQKCEPPIKGAESKQSKDSFNLEQKYAQSDLSNDVLITTSIPPKDKEIITSGSVKIMREATVTEKKKHDTESLISNSFEVTHDPKTDAVIPKVLPLSGEDISVKKQTILQETVGINQKAKEATAPLEFEQKELQSDVKKKDPSEKTVFQTGQETKQHPCNKNDAIISEPETKPEEKYFKSVKPESAKETSLIEHISTIHKPPETSEEFHSKEGQKTHDTIQHPIQSKDEKEQIILQHTVPPQKKEPVQTETISLEKKSEAVTSVEMTSFLSQKETAPTEKEISEILPPQENVSFHPEAMTSKNGIMAPSAVSLFTEEIKETKESEKPSATVKAILSEKKVEIQSHPVAPEKKIVPLPSSPDKIKDSKHEQAALEKTVTAEAIITITDEKENIPQYLGKDSKKDDSVLQVISSDKTVLKTQHTKEKEEISKSDTDVFEKKKQLADSETGVTDVHLPSREKEKPISFISNFAGDKVNGVSDMHGEIKTVKPKDSEKQDGSKDKLLPDPCLSKEDEKTNVQHATTKTEATKFLPQESITSTNIKTNDLISSAKESSSIIATVSTDAKKIPIESSVASELLQKTHEEVKPESVKKDDVIIPSEVKVPEKSGMIDEIISPQSHVPILEKDSAMTVIESKEEKILVVQKEKGIPPSTTISAPCKEPEKLEIQSKDKKDSEMQKLQDASKEKTVIQAKEVQLYPLDVSGEVKLKEVPARDEEMKQTETKEPCVYSLNKDNVLQHKRIESVVPKDTVMQQSKIDSIEMEPKKRPSFTMKEQIEDAIEEKQIQSPQKVTDATLMKDKGASFDPKSVSHSPTEEEMPQPPVAKEMVLSEAATSNILSEPSMKVASSVTSLVSRDNDMSLPSITDDKISLSQVPSVTQEESKSDGAKGIKATEERPIPVPKETVQEKVLLDADNLDIKAISIDQSSSDIADAGKETNLNEDSKTDEDINAKQNAVNDRKTLPITVNGLVPHLGGGEKVELPESDKAKQEEKDHLQKTEEKIKECQKEKLDISTDSTEAVEPLHISDEQKPVEISKEITENDIDNSASRDDQNEIAIDQDTQETVMDVEELSDTREVEQKESVDDDIKSEGDKIIDTSANLEKEAIASPKKKKLITKSEEVKGIRSASPHKENVQMRKRLHKRSKSREKSEISKITAKQVNKEADKEENEEEKVAQDAAQKSPKKRRLRRAHRSADERETSSVPDSSKIPTSPVKKPSTAPTQKGLTSPKKTAHSRNGLLSPTKSLKGDKKLPPIKAAVGFAPNPNLKNIKSKIGSFDNIHYKPKGGDKKVITAKKLEWNASSKVKSLENSNYRPGGGDKKVITQKLDFKEKAQAKSMDSESDTDAIDVTKGERKKDADEEEAPTIEAQESKEPDSVDATGESSEDQELTAKE